MLNELSPCDIKSLLDKQPNSVVTASLWDSSEAVREMSYHINSGNCLVFPASEYFAAWDFQDPHNGKITWELVIGLRRHMCRYWEDYVEASYGEGSKPDLKLWTPDAIALHMGCLDW